MKNKLITTEINTPNDYIKDSPNTANAMKKAGLLQIIKKSEWCPETEKVIIYSTEYVFTDGKIIIDFKKFREKVYGKNSI